MAQKGYDVQGNLANKNGQLYSFDYGNRLRTVPNKEAYLYDGHGRRVQTTKIDGSKTLWQYSQSGQMLFSWNGPSSEKTHENVYLGGSLVATIDHDWPSNAVIATKYQHTDALGSPVAVTNEAGTVIDRTNYEPYGAAINKPAYEGIGYTGHVMDGATGLTYMQQRYYDKDSGRFLSIDPVAANSSTGANFNRYWYANSNPYKFMDPDGRIICNRSRAGMSGCQDNDPLGPQRPMPGNDCRFCFGNATKSSAGSNEKKDQPSEAGAFVGGVVKGVVSYGKGLVDAPKHMAKVFGLLGEDEAENAMNGTAVTLKAAYRVGSNTEVVAKHMTDAYKAASPAMKAELQGRLVGRVAVSFIVTGHAKVPLGPIISGVAVAGNALNAGTTYQNEAMVIDAALFGERP